MAARLLMTLSLLCVAGVAQADIISMSEASCRGADKGAHCEGDSGPGTCQPGRCCRNDYSDGPPPKSVCSDCLTCQPAPAKPAPAKPTPVAPNPAAPTPAAPEKAPPEEAAAKEKSGCDVGLAGGPFGAGALALGLLLAIGLRRTRR